MTPQQLYNRLIWHTSEDPYDPLTSITFGSFRLLFPSPMDRPVQYAFLESVRTIDPGTGRDVLILAAWLRANGIPFAIRFAWDRTKGIMDNLRAIPAVRRMAEAARTGIGLPELGPA